MTAARIASDLFHTGFGPGAVAPPPPIYRCVPRAVACDPTEPISFGDFLEARNKIAREAQADAPRLLGNLHRPACPAPCAKPYNAPSNMPTLLPKLGEVLPVKPEPIEKPIIERHVRTLEIMTGRIIDVVM